MYRNSDREQKNERRPKVETATRPWERASGNGDRVAGEDIEESDDAATTS